MRSSGATSATGTLLGTLVGMVMRGSIMAAVLCGFRRVQLPPVAQGRARATPTGERLLASLLVLEILVEQKWRMTRFRTQTRFLCSHDTFPVLLLTATCS